MYEFDIFNYPYLIIIGNDSAEILNLQFFLPNCDEKKPKWRALIFFDRSPIP